MSTNPNVFAPLDLLLRQTVFWGLQPLLIAVSLYLAHTKASLDTHTFFVLLAFIISVWATANYAIDRKLNHLC